MHLIGRRDKRPPISDIKNDLSWYWNFRKWCKHKKNAFKGLKIEKFDTNITHSGQFLGSNYFLVIEKLIILFWFKTTLYPRFKIVIKTAPIGEILQKLLKSDPVTSDLDFDLVAPFLFTSEVSENGLADTDSLKDCIQTAATTGSELVFENSWVASQGENIRICLVLLTLNWRNCNFNLEFASWTYLEIVLIFERLQK